MKRGSGRFWDVPSSGILLLLLLTVSERLFATDWAPGLEIAALLTLLGCLLGLALGFSSYKRGGVFWLALGYSISLIPLSAGGIFYHQIPWLERMVSLGGRLANSWSLFVTNQPVPDTLLFVIFAGVGFWGISYFAGFALVRRGDFAAAVIPSGVILLIIQVYDSSVADRVFILAFYGFLCLLLLGRLNVVRKRQFWKEKHVSFSAESWTDLNVAIPLVSAVLIFLAWIAPVTGRPVVPAKVAWEDVTRPLETMRQNLGNAVAGLRGYQQAAAVEFYGDNLALGDRAATGLGTYLRIVVPLTGRADRYYWRVRTYDQYINNEWHSVYNFTEPFTPGQPSIPLADVHGLSSEFTFTAPQVNLALLVTPAHPIWISRPAVLSFTPASGNNIDPLMFRADPNILIGEQYSVHANIYNPTIDQLQKAGAIYPSWVSDHYLQLPSDISPRLITLAQSIITSTETPYEKVTAITDYLRSTITYAETVDPPPDGIDPLSWFLFYTHSGFCNYYATAEVMLLRSVGVPSRMVVGFAQGAFDPPDKYTVLEKDAHAWPEVYFPGIGWVEFEPTGSQPKLVRLQGGESSSGQVPIPTPQENGKGSATATSIPAEESPASPGSGAPPNSLLRVMVFFGVVVVAMLGFLLAYTTGFLDRTVQFLGRIFRTPLPVLLTGVFQRISLPQPEWLRRAEYFSTLKPIGRSFGVVYQSLRWLGGNPSPSQTPAEAALALTEKLPEVTSETHALLQEYQLALYSRRPGDLVNTHLAVRTIRRQVLKTVFRQRWNAFRLFFLRPFTRNKE